MQATLHPPAERVGSRSGQPAVYRDWWYPTLQKTKDPGFPTAAAPAMAACAAFYKESRMKFVDPTKPYRKSGGMGHPQICCAFELLDQPID
jgi:hypothetical protein